MLDPRTAPLIGIDRQLPALPTQRLRGPALPTATEETKEQRRFDRFDKNRDNRISRNELLAPRAAAFRKLREVQ